MRVKVGDESSDDRARRTEDEEPVDGEEMGAGGTRPYLQTKEAGEGVLAQSMDSIAVQPVANPFSAATRVRTSAARSEKLRLCSNLAKACAAVATL